MSRCGCTTADPSISDVGPLQGKKIAIGPFESGTRALALQLLSVNGTVLPPTTLLPLSGKDAADALQAGTIDAAFFVSPAESPMIEKLASDPNLNLLSFERADAYTRRFPYLTELLLPKGVFDFMANIPKENVKLLSPTANLIAQDTLHPALAYLLMRAATQIHGESGLLHKAGTFPAPLDANFPLSPEATRYYKTGAPFLQRYLPFWAANLVERLWVMLVPAIAIMVPLFRTIPPLYRWRVRSRIYRWYARLKEIELQLDEEPRPVPLTGHARAARRHRALGQPHSHAARVFGKSLQLSPAHRARSRARAPRDRRWIPATRPAIAALTQRAGSDRHCGRGRSRGRRTPPRPPARGFCASAAGFARCAGRRAW